MPFDDLALLSPAETIRPDAGDPVDSALRGDPAGLHDACDHATRARYRAAVEELARWSSRTAAEVAAAAAGLSRAALDPASARGHVGYHLIDDGRAELEAAIGAAVPRRIRLSRRLHRHAVGIYLGAVSSLALAMATALVLFQPGDAGSLALLAALAILPAAAAFLSLAEIAVETIHSLTSPTPPLPRLDLGRGIPARLDTLVVVPCLVRSHDEVDRLIHTLEDHAASAPGLRVCLLGDFGDAPAEHMPGDDELLAHARAAIHRLNGEAAGPARRFLFLHRPRRWSPSEAVWMGRERKRGKLADLGAAIIGGDSGAFLPSPDAALLERVAFVITLDVDGRMTRGAALRLIETMAHPLNRAELDPGGRIRRGYGVLQPRIAANPLDPRASRHERWGAADLGPAAPPDKRNHLHQDRFGEATYFGKGLHDVRAFAAATDGRLDDVAILSHDLLEGCSARTAAVADACFLEDAPPDHRSEAARRHRWMRGDWQNLVWMLRDGGGLSLLSRWKVAGNVRRNLVPLSLMALLVVGLLAAPAPAPWVLAVLSVPVLPRALALFWETRKLVQRAVAGQLGAIDLAVGAARLAGTAALRAGFAVAVLPFDALLAADAIARSTWRLLVSGRRVLEWSPSGGPVGPASPLAHVVHLRGQLLAAIALGGLVHVLRPEAVAVAA
ncbi:MAG TPA: hypothetical protein VK698_11740, partial [Kofleriaceae bacterium]|nr:hypothetical protein [Kofleriaceae bacterium]